MTAMMLSVKLHLKLTSHLFMTIMSALRLPCYRLTLLGTLYT